MMNLPRQVLAIAKRAASASAIAIATSGPGNAAAALVAPPALPVATVQAPKKLVLAGNVASATEVALSNSPAIGYPFKEAGVRKATDQAPEAERQ